MESIIYKHQTAKRAIITLVGTRQIFIENEGFEYVRQWLHMKNEDVECLISEVDEKCVNIVLLEAIDYDPEGQFKKGMKIIYIITDYNFRRKGYALKALENLKKRHNLVAFLVKQSINLFQKVGFVIEIIKCKYGYIPKARYPPFYNATNMKQIEDYIEEQDDEN